MYLRRQIEESVIGFTEASADARSSGLLTMQEV
jgi:hypothetical protein